jgi:hypothetical protein
VFRTKNDWAELIEQDKEDLQIDISDEEISQMEREISLKL